VKFVNTDASLKTSLTGFLNETLKTKFPQSISVLPNVLEVSTYTSSNIKLYEKGILLPMEGIIYPHGKEFKRVEVCPELKDTIDKNNDANDITVILGQCSVLSL